MTINELIAALEKADGPNQGLDKAIAKVCGIEWSSDEDGQFGGYGIMPRRIRFTASIDAALTLVPERRRAYLTVLETGRAKATCEDGVPVFKAYSTAAIALCIAALRARKP